MFIFSGFSEKGNTALNNAVHFAEDMGHTYVGSEHILAGLLKDPTSVAGVILSGMHISFSSFREAVKRYTGAGIPTVLSEKDITPAGEKIIRRAVAEATGQGMEKAGTEHLLTAVISESTCSACRILEEMGICASELHGSISALGNVGGETKRKREHRYQASSDSVSCLEKYGRNLTKSAALGKTEPAVGRDAEIERVMRILCRKNKNNPCLIGEPGVGKTAIAEGLAYRTAMGDVPSKLKNMQVYSLELTAMVAGAKYRGDFEERIRNAVDEAANAGNIILFIDEIHNLIGAGSAEGAVDAANILKPVLARGTIRLIGATTAEEYRKNIEKDAALERRFQKITVEEPTPEECLGILRSIRPSYERFHGVKISDKALTAAVEMSVRYITDRFLPDKAIDLMDEAAAGVSMSEEKGDKSITELEERLKTAGRNKISAVNTGDFEGASVYRQEEKEIAMLLGARRTEMQEKAFSPSVVDASHIASQVSIRTKIPVGRLCESEAQRLMGLEKKLSSVIIGQDEAIRAVAVAVRRSRAGISDPSRPVGTFLFCGPTGVGKTALAKALAEGVFGNKDAIIKFDMSEFSEKHSLARLIGAPPGYQGFDDGGQLVNKLRRMPYCVLLFDEIEKAHPDIFGFLLPVLEEGVLTASDGKKADCRNCIIVMTSNAGAVGTGENSLTVGFYDGDGNRRQQERVEEALKNIFPPEFRGRIDDVIIFSRLSKESMKKIAEKMLGEIKQRLEKQGISLITDEGTVEYLAEKGYDKAYGARNLRKLIRDELSLPLSEIICRHENVERVYCTLKDGRPYFSFSEEEKSAEKIPEEP